MIGNTGKKLCSIYSAEFAEVEGSELWRLLQVFPQAGMPDDTNYIIPSSLDDCVNPFLISDLVDAEGLNLEGSALVLAVGKELAKDDRDWAILGEYQQIVTLSSDPIWKLWQKKYEEEDRAAFEADYLKVREIFTALPEYNANITFQQAADWLLAGMRLL